MIISNVIHASKIEKTYILLIKKRYISIKTLFPCYQKKKKEKKKKNNKRADWICIKFDSSTNISVQQVPQSHISKSTTLNLWPTVFSKNISFPGQDQW